MSRLRLLAFAFLAFGASDAGAQMVCGQRASIIESLDQKYKERPNAFGISGEKTLFELFTSEGGSWTILMTRPGGVSCIMAVGQSWEEFPAPPAKMTGL
jgi:hypothetical protein